MAARRKIPLRTRRQLEKDEHGRATVDLLQMNNDWMIRARQIWKIAGIHPPLD
ncbi:MAG: hypothetical protein KDK27_19700 [Leptospiraceae bacterium]|nr:hypothetical protein [Leptospiraceae bacterium]